MRPARRSFAPRFGRTRLELRRNWQLKALAVTFAAVLWLFVVGEREAEIGVIVPIELRNIPPGTVVAADVEREVQVRLAGPQTFLASLSPDQVRVSVDVSGATPDEPQHLRLTPATVSMPRGLDVVRVSPPEIIVRVERIARRRVPVEVALVGRAAEGLEVRGWRVEPADVEIVGGAHAVSRIRAVETVDLDLAGAARDLVRDLPLESPIAGVRIEGPAVVRAHVRIGRAEP